MYPHVRMKSAPLSRQKAKILERKSLSTRCTLLRLAASTDFHWTPGQYLVVFGQEDGGKPSYFSFASALRYDAPGVFDLAVTEPSIFTPTDGAEVDCVWVAPPSGGFPLSRIASASRLVLIGMGSGIAPLRALTQYLDAQKETSPQITLLHGARAASEAMFSDEFSLAKDGVDYRLILSAPGAEWTGRIGRVQSHLDDLPLEDSEFCLCGSTEMVFQVQQLLFERGVPEDRITAQGA
jgi:NAD(P)H-flavin reductase